MTSPAASGPAGSEFEGQVGAHYLLTMLVGAEPRGLPATTIDRVEFQRADSGRPLDDVIIHAHDSRGAPAALEVQVKRSMTFAQADPVFRDVSARHERRGVLDHPVEPVIGLAGGETRWRMMTSIDATTPHATC